MQSEKEKSAYETYKKFLDLMLYDLPLEQLDELVIRDVTGYGTTLDEKILEIERLRKLVIDQREQSTGYKMSFDINPVHRRINSEANSAIFIDEIGIIMSIDGENHLIPLRISTALEFISGNWKVVHLHGSVAINTEGDTWHKEEHRKKIEELEKLVSEKTADLVTKNKELEIEASLEKVRSVAMGIREPIDMVAVCRVISDQLLLLGVKDIRNVQTAIINEKKGVYLNYQYFTSYDNGIVEESEYKKHPKVNEMVQEMKRSENSIFSGSFEGEELNRFREYRKQDNQFLDPLLDEATSMHYYFYSIGSGGLGLSTYKPLKDDVLEIFKRFHNVFTLAYRRFIDVEQAIAQAREAQIEGALERVRSKTIAMHNSNDVGDTVITLFDEVLKLGLDKSIRCGIGILEGNEKMETWSATSYPNGEVDLKMGMLDMTIHPMLIGLKKAWESGETSYSYDYIGDDVLRYYEALNKEPEYPFQADLESLPKNEYHRSFFYSEGILFSFAPNRISDEAAEVLDRFARVFGQTYRRYLDLKKAEAQAKEAKIEAALDKVRAVAMSMMKPDDLLNVCEVMFKELQSLKFTKLRNTLISTYQDDKDYFDEYDYSDASGGYITKIPYSSHPTLERFQKQIWRTTDAFAEFIIGEDQLNDWKEHRRTNGEPDDPRLENISALYCYFYSIGPASIGISTFNSISEEMREVLKRFKNVFDLAYRRYIDIAQAEAQAREAQIQLALERVRARTMAMHKSEELAETAAVLFQQMTELGVTPERLNICLIKEETKILEVWSTDQKGIKINHHFNASLDEPTTGKRVYDAWKEKKKSLVIDLSGQELNDWIRYVREVMGMTIKEELVKEHRIHSVAFFSHGMVLTTTPEPLPEESIHLLERFADVFNLTYRRFLDLQNAEAQVRESQIEAALERVRAKAMAMNNSADLSATIKTLFSELDLLGLTPVRCGLGIFNKACSFFELWVTTRNEIEILLNLAGTLTTVGNPVLEEIYKHWELQKEYHPVLQGEELKEYIAAIQKQFPIPDWPEGVPRYDHYFYFLQGAIYVVDTKPSTDEELVIYRKFTSVMALTYQRYEDIKESEARALEAIKKSSLDRVRAEIASMRSTEDLNRITPIIWRELKTLEVPFFRCGVFIVNEDNAKVQVYLTTPDGKSLGVLNLPFDSNKLTSNTVEFWRRKEVYKEHWNKEEFISWSKSMLELGQIKSQQEYQGAEQPPESLDLHFIPFEQGMLYVGNIEPLASEKIDLVKSLAETFSIAYARYEDFDRLEIAKREVESAFSDLDLLSKELKIKNEELETENQRKALELEEARQLQLSMLPKEIPKLPNLDIAVYMKTATEVGGDYYDFYIQSDGTLNILVGDATGHGMKSGMMVSIMKSFFIANRNNISLKQFFDNSNDSIKNMQLGRLMMALMGVQITSTKVVATNAGMPSLVYFRNKSQKAGEFVINNFPLGAMKNNKYLLKEINYESGDTLLMMSDGFAELNNMRDEQYGYSRIIKEFKSVVQKSSNEIVDHLKNSASEWSKGVEPDDDVTFVVIKVI